MRRHCIEPAPDLTRATKRAGSLVAGMLREMQLAAKEPQRLNTEEWAQLFGRKQCMVANLQKLVQVLTALSGSRAKNATLVDDHPEGEAMSLQDAQILSTWLREESPTRDT